VWLWIVGCVAVGCVTCYISNQPCVASEARGQVVTVVDVQVNVVFGV
jgi:hypothetical protein